MKQPILLSFEKLLYRSTAWRIALRLARSMLR
jgi:hypothetical protein